MQVSIEIAGLPVAVTTVWPCLPEAHRDYITEKEPLFAVETTASDIETERRKSMEECLYEGIEYPDYTEKELESTAVYRKIAIRLPEYDALVFHGSAVGVNGKSYLFTAKSGTGKTTHTNLWLKNIPGSFIINGDKPVLRVIDGTVFVCPTPWMGKENLGCNRTLPLAGLCFLNRGNENSIGRTDFISVMPRLLGQAFRPPEKTAMLKTVHILERIGNAVPLYELTCDMSDAAAETAFKGMDHDNV